jgi:Cof subfamily protein (haloacid dehalogenase superfamily)
MNQNTKILFTDLDGTLLNDAKSITSGNRFAIEKALKRGHKIVITTGRPLSSAIIISKELGLTMEGCYIISYNGGIIYDSYLETPVYESRLSNSHVRHLFDEAYKRNLHCQTYSETEIISEHEHPGLFYYRDNTNIPAKVVPNFEKELTSSPHKVVVVSVEDPEALQDFQREMSSWTDGQLDSIFSTPQLLEYMNPGVSKGSAVLKLAEILNVPIENTISAGDAPNDISMLQVTKVAAVMANADDNMKSYGTYITKNDNNHDGVAEIIETFM